MFDGSITIFTLVKAIRTSRPDSPRIAAAGMQCADTGKTQTTPSQRQCAKYLQNIELQLKSNWVLRLTVLETKPGVFRSSRDLGWYGSHVALLIFCFHLRCYQPKSDWPQVQTGVRSSKYTIKIQNI